MPFDPTADITAVILAGGRGRRMEGADKGLVTLRGRPLAAHVLERLRPQVGRLVIVANRNAERYAQLGATVIADSVAAGEGPLAGLAAGLAHAETEWVLAVSCDTPLLPDDLVARLHRCAAANGAGICTAHDGERLHATVILTRRSNLTPLLRFLDGGGRKVRDFLTQAGAGTADFSDEAAAFANVNDRDALARLESAGTVRQHPPVLGFVAFSGTGKTTLLERLIPLLRARGLRLALLKHAHHDFDIDVPGKDSWRLRQAGATQVLIASRRRSALITEHDDDRPEPRLQALLAQVDPGLDLVLVEGFKHEAYAKVELRREALGKPCLYPDDAAIIAVASDRPAALADAPCALDINQPEQIAAFVGDWLQRQRPNETR